MAAQSNQKASNPTVSMTYSPSSDRALRAIADELRRIGDALESKAAAAVAVEAVSGEAEADADAPALSPQEEALFQSLREWRAGEARKLGMPPYIVATDKVLRAVAQKRPASVEDLRQIPGFGPAKTAKYGAGVVEIVATA
jgi:ATP-dependent DNA helicase RecQ